MERLMTHVRYVKNDTVNILYLSSTADSESSFVLVFICLSFNFLVTLTKCFIRYYLIVFTEHHVVAIQTFVRKKDFIIFKKLLLSLILIMSSLKKYSFLVFQRRFVQRFLCFYSYFNLSQFYFSKTNFSF